VTVAGRRPTKAITQKRSQMRGRSFPGNIGFEIRKFYYKQALIVLVSISKFYGKIKS
jgi:hypothetical protein